MKVTENTVEYRALLSYGKWAEGQRPTSAQYRREIISALTIVNCMLVAAFIALMSFVLIGGCGQAYGYEIEIDLDAIASIESSHRPDAYNKASGCIGLYQINPDGALADWNIYHPQQQYTRDQLFDPQINARIADWYLHVRIPGLLRHYDLPTDVESVLRAYNQGAWSMKQGNYPQETRDYVAKYERLTQ